MGIDIYAKVLVLVPVSFIELKAKSDSVWCCRLHGHINDNRSFSYCPMDGSAMLEAWVNTPSEAYVKYLKEKRMNINYAFDINSENLFSEHTPKNSMKLFCRNQICGTGCKHQNYGFGFKIGETESLRISVVHDIKPINFSKKDLDSFMLQVSMEAQKLGISEVNAELILQLVVGF